MPFMDSYNVSNKTFVIWNRRAHGWLTANPEELTTERQGAHSFQEGDPRLRSARLAKEVFQVYPDRGA